jgi:hypothetical protein
MNWNDLKAQHQEELVAYWKGRAERQDQLRDQQHEMLMHVTVNGPKGQEIMQGVFRQQNEAFMDQERDGLDKLLFAQEHERQNFFEKEVARNRLKELLFRGSEKNRGR